MRMNKMKKRIIKVGSRDSKLAVIQSRLVMDIIEKNHPEIELKLVTMKTTGDLILDRTLDKIGGKGLFVKELDAALRDGRIDISVHSLKDMPMETPEDLPLLAFSKREVPFDALVLPKEKDTIDSDLPLGSSSPRRNLQLSQLYPELEQKSVRGNVLTRLKKLDSGDYSALILAHAGLTRLGLENRITKTFTPEEMIPSAGQGVMVVQGRQEEDNGYLECVNDLKSKEEVLAERAFVSYLDGGCSAPIGAFAQIKGDQITIEGLYCDEKMVHWNKGKISGPTSESLDLAISLAKRLKGERD